MRHLVLAAACLALSCSGCATLFRAKTAKVHIETDPPGAEAYVGKEKVATPADVEVARAGFTEVKVSAPGYVEHRGSMRKHLDGWWAFADIATCIVPVLLCVPLIADGVTGAWIDVDRAYRARMQRDEPLFAPSPFVVGAPPKPSAAPPTAPAAPPPESTMSDSERRAAARAAYQEGVELQAQNKHAAAIERLLFAQSLVDAPTNLLHLAECYAATGKLVEAYETYETLAHKDDSPSAPEPFRDAIAQGRKEMADVKPRIASLRVDVEPSPQSFTSLTIAVNGRAMPLELVGIARPVNPGAYRITATAHGLVASAPIELSLKEGETRSVLVKLRR